MRQAAGVLTEMAGDRAVVLDADNRELITLNPVGSVIWQVLEDERSVDEIVELVAARFPDAPPEVIADDVATFLEELAEAGLLATDAPG